MRSELFVSRLGGRTWVALREDGRTVELRVERPEGRVRAGRVVLGRVTRVVPAIQSAFVDIGEERDAFLHVSDLVPAGGMRPARGAPTPPIQDRLHAGTELVVQVARESPEGKGDRVTCEIGLAGRLLVLMPHETRHAVSRRIVEVEERERLLECLSRVPVPGLVTRTAAAGASEAALTEEAVRLAGIWRSIEELARAGNAPRVLYEPPSVSMAMLRDVPSANLARVVTDDVDEQRRLVAWAAEFDPALEERLELRPPHPSLFEALGIDREIAEALDRRVQLPSGGFIVIEPTEALVSIDVNTGRSVHGRGLDATVLETNLEAASEIVRQLRLRDLGGIIVVDFIDMSSPEHGQQVVERFRTALAGDRARSRIFGLSELGLLQLTRERVRTTLHDAVAAACPLCHGAGSVRRPEIVAAEALERLRLGDGSPTPGRFRLRAHPQVAAAVRQALAAAPAGSRVVLEIEEAAGDDPNGFALTALAG